jgi:PhoPQ-activated pathogenicity-related protein
MTKQGRAWIGFVPAVFLVACCPARADLDSYVKQNDGAFAWKVEGKEATPVGTMWGLKLTSQVWQGITWTHRLEIFEPAQIFYPDTVFLFITGGSNTSQPKPEDAAEGFILAQLCGARCAVLHQVPNQPLLDGKKEDALIVETFLRYLSTHDENWPLLFPMVNSAVRAMDAVEAWSKQEGKPAIKRFMVAGASKRGWTTWLTGAVDKRVAAIGPLVIVTLKMRAQNPHQLETWGRNSEQIEDYTRAGLTERLETPDGMKLWKMVDPYSYRDRLTMPKILINGTNDRYWTLDALNLFSDDLSGPKWVVYVPNAGHGLEKNRDYATHGLAALFRCVASGRPMPTLSWKHETSAQGDLKLSVTASPSPKTALLRTARSETSDFREATWTSSPMLQSGQTLTAEVAKPARGNVALCGDLEYEIDGIPYHLSTQVRQSGSRAAP